MCSSALFQKREAGTPGEQAWQRGSGVGDLSWPPEPASSAFSAAAQAAMGSVGSQRLQEPSTAGTPHGSMVMSFSFDSGQLEEAAARAQGGRARGIPIVTESGE